MWPEVHNWLRVFVENECTWPTPGEFLCILAKPYLQFPWFYQATSPFIYSGNWFETEFYTSGIVDAVNEEDGEIVSYDVRIKTEVATIAPSDFAEYEVGDRVTVLKTFSSNPTGKFSWKDLGEADSDWVIVPITFYGED